MSRNHRTTKVIGLVDRLSLWTRSIFAGKRRRVGGRIGPADVLETRQLLAGGPVGGADAESHFEAPMAPPTPVTGVPATEHDPFYRAYNPTADYHFFTTSKAEFDNAVRNGYQDETAGRTGLYVSNTPQPGFAPIFRLYNLGTGRHYYTLNSFERDALVNIVRPPQFGPDTRTSGWRYEKVEGYVRPGSGTGGTTEVYRLYNNNSGVHLFVESAAVKDSILSRFPGIWVQHSSFGFAAPRGLDDTRYLGYSGAPLKVLEVYAQGRSLSPNDPIHVDFRLPDGSTQSVVAAGVRDGNVIVALPPVAGFGGGRSGAATVSIDVRQGGTAFRAFSDYHIEDLPTTGLAPGRLLGLFVEQSEDRIRGQIRSAVALGKASRGSIDTSPLVAELEAQIASLQNLKFSADLVRFGFAGSVEVGQRTDTGEPLMFTQASLTMLDQVLGAWAQEPLLPGGSTFRAASLASAVSSVSNGGDGNRSGSAGVAAAAGDDELKWVQNIGAHFVDGLKNDLKTGLKTVQARIAQAAAVVPGGTAVSAILLGVPQLVAAAINFGAERASNIARGEVGTADAKYREFQIVVEPGLNSMYQFAKDQAIQFIDKRSGEAGALKSSADTLGRISRLLDPDLPDSTASQTQAALSSGQIKGGGARISAGGSEVGEASGSVSIVMDDFAPRTDSVTVRAKVNDGSEATVSPSEITISPDDDFASASFDVSGVDDASDDGDQSFHVEFEIETEDSAFEGYTPQVISLRTRDDGLNSNPGGGGDNGGGGGGDNGGGGGGGGGGGDNGQLPDLTGTYVGTTTSNYGDPQSPYDTTLAISTTSAGNVLGTIRFVDNGGNSGSSGVSGTATGSAGSVRLSLTTDSGETIELSGDGNSLSGTITRIFQGQTFTQSISLTKQ